MNFNSESQQRLPSSQGTEMDSKTISNLPNADITPTEPLTTVAHGVGGYTQVTEMGTVSTPSPSSSSDGSSNGFVKVEHSDVQPSVALSSDTLPVRMEQLMQLHDDNYQMEERERERDRRLLIESAMNHGFGSDEPHSGILPRTQEFAESTIGRVMDAASGSVEKITEGADTATGVVAAFGDTIHLAGDTVKEQTEDKIYQAYESAKGFGEKAGNMVEDSAHYVGDGAHQAISSAKDSTSDMLSGMVHGISDTAQNIHGMAPHMTHTLEDNVNEAMNTAADALTDTVQKTRGGAKAAGDIITGAAIGAIHSAEDTFINVAHKIEDSVPLMGDAFSGPAIHGAAKAAEDNLVGFGSDVGGAAKHGASDTRYDIEVDKVLRGGEQVSDYLTKEWGSTWGQHGGEFVGADMRHAQNGDGVKEIHATDGGSAEESTFDRRGPLTIPHQTPEDALRLDDDTDLSGNGGFKVAPRPPTPPKELDDEDVKPTTIDVGQAAHKATTGGEHPRSILKRSAQSSKFNLKWMDPRILDLIYWRDPKKSGAVLGIIVLTLLVFAKFPLIAVLSYLGLAVLGGTLGFRIYKLVEAQIKKTDGANPFQTYLNRELHLPQEKVHQQVDVLIEHAHLIVTELRRLFLVENIVDSIKFGLLLWALTYVSCWFSGLCLLILAVLAVFTIPKVYEVYQEPIDRNMSVAKQQVDAVSKKINEKVPPFLKKPIATVAAGDVNHEKTN